MCKDRKCMKGWATARGAVAINKLEPVGLSHMGEPRVQVPGLGLYPTDKEETFSIKKRCSKKLQIQLPYDPVIPPLGVYSKILKTFICKDV